MSMSLTVPLGSGSSAYPLMAQHSQAKITQFEDAFRVTIDVVRLHIQMQHLICMKETQALQHRFISMRVQWQDCRIMLCSCETAC